MSKQTITVKSDEENPEPIELIAQSIIQVSEAFDKIRSSRLSNRAVVLLLADMIPSKHKIGIREIETILYYAPKLKETYVKRLPVVPLSNTKK